MAGVMREVPIVFSLKTGWLNFSGAYTAFQRIRSIYLLASFKGLESLA